MSRDPFAASILPPAPSVPAAASAVEIVTALGDSVVGVDQLASERPRPARARTFLTVGGGLLLAAAATFAVGVHDAARDADARARWLAEQRPAWAFHTTHHSIGADALALGGALAGLGLCAAGLLAARKPARSRFRVGVGDGVDVPLADAGRAHTLVDADGQGGFVVDITGLGGELRTGGRSVPLAELQAAGQLQVPVRADTHLRARLGHATFHVRGQAGPGAKVGPAPLLLERRGLTFFAGSLAAHAAVLGLMSMASPAQETLVGQLEVDEYNHVSLQNQSIEDLVPPPPEDGDADGGEAVPSAAASLALTDGTLGRPDGASATARLKVADRGLQQALSREEAIAAATRAGVLGALEAVGPIRALDGVDVASGMDDIDFTGGFSDGDGGGAPVGSFGWGVRGFGSGCGTAAGTPCQGIKAGPFATIGEPGGNGSNWRNLRGFGPGPGKRVGTVPTVKLCATGSCAVAPELDAATIRRYVHRNLNKIRFCYEKELLGQPALEGTVTANFTLDGNGHVVDSRASGVSPEVSTCVASVLSNIAFPKVAAPGIYPIKYPFTFRPAGR